MNEKSNRRKDDFKPHCEQFRTLSEIEYLSLSRSEAAASKLWVNGSFTHLRVAYETLPGGFTICLLKDSDMIYTGCSHCSKNDSWLFTRGKMKAFRRAVEHSGGILLQNEEETKGGEEGKGIFEALKDHLDKSKSYGKTGEQKDFDLSQNSFQDLFQALSIVSANHPEMETITVSQSITTPGPIKIVQALSVVR